MKCFGVNIKCSYTSIFVFFIGWCIGSIVLLIYLFETDTNELVHNVTIYKELINNEVSFVSSLEMELEKKVKESLQESFEGVGLASDTLSSILAAINASRPASPGRESYRMHSMFHYKSHDTEGEMGEGNAVKSYLATLLHVEPSTSSLTAAHQLTVIKNCQLPLFNPIYPFEHIGNRDMNRTTDTITTFTNHTSVAPPPLLEKSVAVTMMENTENMMIYLDWSLDDRMFTFLNYKALESLLAVHPAATYRAIVPAPHQHYIHKTGNIISNTIFQKYSKRGYDISVNAVGTMAKQAQVAPDYWAEHGTNCCSRCNKDCRGADHTQPLHVLAYIRLMKLYTTGGLFSDLTHLVLGPLSASVVQQGYVLNTVCSRRRDMPEWRVENAASEARNQYFQYERKLHVLTNGGKRKGKGSARRRDLLAEMDGERFVNFHLDEEDCTTSSLFAFHTAKSPLLLCVLEHYNRPEFLSCVVDSTWSRAADASIVRYFNTNNRTGSSNTAGADTLSHNRGWRNDGGADCLRAAFDDCFAKAGQRNGLAALSPQAFNALHSEAPVKAQIQTQSKTQVPSKVSFSGIGVGVGASVNEQGRLSPLPLLVEGFGDDADAAQAYLLPAAGRRVVHSKSGGFSNSVNSGSGDAEGEQDWQWRLSSASVRVVWLGRLGISGLWYPQPYASSSLLSSLINSIKLTRVGTMERDEQCYVHRRAANGRCSTYATTLPALVDAGITPTSFHTGREEQSCAPQIVIPGFYKSASSFVFNMIAAHPQVLMPLVGAQMKETNCYSGQVNSVSKLRKRAFCYPYIEPTENFVTIDGTVYYATDATTAHSLVTDNPNLKVVFTVRQPMERLYSNFKFAIQTFQKFGAFDSFINQAFDEGRKFGRLRIMVSNVLADKQYQLLIGLVKAKHRRLMKARTGVDFDVDKERLNRQQAASHIILGAKATDNAAHGHLRGSGSSSSTVEQTSTPPAPAATTTTDERTKSESDTESVPTQQSNEGRGGHSETDTDSEEADGDAGTAGGYTDTDTEAGDYTDIDTDDGGTDGEEEEELRRQRELKHAVAFFKAAKAHGSEVDAVAMANEKQAEAVVEMKLPSQQDGVARQQRQLVTATSANTDSVNEIGGSEDNEMDVAEGERRRLLLTAADSIADATVIATDAHATDPFTAPGPDGRVDVARVRTKRSPSSADEIRKRNQVSHAAMRREQEEERVRIENLDSVEIQLLQHFLSPNNTQMVALMQYYFTEGFTGPGPLATIMMHSIQFIGVLQYIKVVGIENVLIIRDTDLSLSNDLVFQATMDRIFAHIGLCRYHIPGGDSLKETLVNKNRLEPQEYDLSREMATRLNAFFAPFVEVMNALLLIQSITNLKAIAAREKVSGVIIRDNNSSNIFVKDDGFVNSDIVLAHKSIDQFHSITNNSAVFEVPANTYTNQKFKYDNTTTAKIASLFATREWFEILEDEAAVTVPVTAKKRSISLYVDATSKSMDSIGGGGGGESGNDNGGGSGDAETGGEGSGDQNVEYNSTLGMLASF